MKRFFVICLVFLASMTAFSQNNEFGVVVGGLNGLSHRYYLQSDFVVQTDLAIGLQRTVASVAIGGGARVEGRSDIWDLALNPNLLYYKELIDHFSILAGCGLSLGMLGGFGASNVNGKFGINAMVAANYKIVSTPLSVSLDFKPGYGLGFNKHGDFSFFDWHLAAGVRYTF